VRILDTPEMQRLHRLKQLGVCDYVFRCANHTRLEHSIGVTHQAHVLLSTLQTQYRRAKEVKRMLNSRDLPDSPYLPPKISEVDKLCVLVACLCHDLGHGPFSHHFEGVLRDLKVHRFSECEARSG
jgi:HD superfamily phosphohydrolase